MIDFNFRKQINEYIEAWVDYKELRPLIETIKVFEKDDAVGIEIHCGLSEALVGPKGKTVKELSGSISARFNRKFHVQIEQVIG